MTRAAAPNALVFLGMFPLLAGCRQPTDSADVAPPYSVKGRHELWSFPLAREEKGPSEKPVVAGELLDPRIPFAFAYAVGSMGTFSVVYVHEDGACDCRFVEEGASGAPMPRRALFKLTAEQTREIRAAVGENGVFGLSREYEAGLADGVDILIACRLGARRKSVTCRNHFPDAVVAFNDFVIERLFAPHRGDARDVSADAAPLFSMAEFLDFGRGAPAPSPRRNR